MKYKNDEISELLVDYLEGDLTEDLKKDLELVVRNSPDREKSFKALGETKNIIKSLQPQMPDLSDAFFDKLHGKIMTGVSKQKPHSRVRLWLEEQSWQNYAAAAVVLFVSGTIFFALTNSTVRFQSAGIEQSGDMLLSISLEVPEAFTDSLLSDRDSSEFLLDAMAEKVAQLEGKNADQLMDKLGE